MKRLFVLRCNQAAMRPVEVAWYRLVVCGLLLQFGWLTSPVLGISPSLAASFYQTSGDPELLSDGGQDSDVAEADQADNDPYGLRRIPDEALDIGVDSREGTLLDGDLTFYDSDNRLVRFGDFFKGDKRPIMMSFNYSNCPKLCSVQLENMVLALRDVDLEVGKDFQFISLSIDPAETTVTAKATKKLYTTLYNRPESNDGWHFLTGKEDAIKRLADQCGYRYKYVAAQKLYSHPPAFILISPEAEIVRYIPGLDYDAKTIRLALIESADGKIGSPVDWALYSLGCFSFDGKMGKYTFQAMALMRIGGLVTVIVIIVGLIPYWFFYQSSDKQVGGGIEGETVENSGGHTAAHPN